MEIRNGAEEVKVDPGKEEPVPDPLLEEEKEKVEGSVLFGGEVFMDPDPVAEKKEKMQTPKKGKKKGHSAPTKGRSAPAKRLPSEKKVMAKKKETNGSDGKTQFSVDLGTAKAIRRFRAQLELEGDGARVTITDAIKIAVEGAMK